MAVAAAVSGRFGGSGSATSCGFAGGTFLPPRRRASSAGVRPERRAPSSDVRIVPTSGGSDPRGHCGSSTTLGSLIRMRKSADSRILDEYGRREPKMVSEWCGQSVRQAKELDHWVGRVRESREQAQKADARLAEALREARELKEELKLSKDDLVRLRGEAELAAQERKKWEDQLEVSKSCIQKLESKLLMLRRVGVGSHGRGTAVDVQMVMSTPELDRVDQELHELLSQRDRLLEEKNTLERLAVEHEREVRILTRALRATPSVPALGNECIASILDNDLRIAQTEAEAMRLQLQAADREVDELQNNSRAAIAELASSRAGRASASARLSTLEADGEEQRALCTELSAKVVAVQAEEEAAREEEVALRREFETQADTFRSEDAAKTKLAREVRELESSLASTRRRAAAIETEGEARMAELEARGAALRAELGAKSAAHKKELERRAARQIESTELEDRVAHLRMALASGESAGAQLEAELTTASQNLAEHSWELRTEEAAGRELQMEAAHGQRREEILRGELADERRKAQEASRVAASLLEQRRQVADEAGEALRLCDKTLDESRATELAVRNCDEQLARSERSCELMRSTLGQRLLAVHAQVREAEGARAAAAQELREERLEHQRLRAQLQGENARRRARLARGTPILQLRDEASP